MNKTILITGGAGFIASHCAALLLQHNYRVKALDNLDAQIHGSERRPPSYLDRRVELVVGDVRSPKAVRRALADVDYVLHLAARVGVGQSMYEMADYTDVNGRGTALLLEAMIERAKKRPFERLVVASSMSIYGEGMYRAADGRLVPDAERNSRQLKRAIWDPGDEAGAKLEPGATPGAKTRSRCRPPKKSRPRPARSTHSLSTIRNGSASWLGAPMTSRPWRCGFSTFTARTRRCRTLIAASSQSLPRG